MPYYAARFRAETPPPMPPPPAVEPMTSVSAHEPLAPAQALAAAPTAPNAQPAAASPALESTASWLPSPSYTVDIMHVVMLLAVIILSIVVAGLGAKLSMLEMMLTAVLQNEATRR
jgi:hypothetical protein